jgi:hypothetical protein
MITLEQVAGWSALIAAVATVIGAVTLMMFFAKGGLWGLANDIASIVLMLATIPVAIAVAALEDGPQFPGNVAWLVAAIGVVSMLLAVGFQVALVTRMRSFEALLPRTLAAGSGVGVWYLLSGLLGFPTLGAPLAILAILSGVGFIAIGYGFRIGGQRHPAAAIGGAVLFVASTTFLTWLGVLLVTDILVLEPFVGTL